MDHTAFSHAAAEIAIGGSGAHFAFCQYTGAHPQAGTTCWIRYTKTGIHEDAHYALVQRLTKNFGRGRRHDAADITVNLLPF